MAMDEMRPVRPWAKKGRRCMATWQLRPENFWPLNLAKGRSFFGTAWSCWVLFRNRPAACEKSATRQSEYAKMWRSCWSHWVEDVSNVLYVSVYLCAFTNPILLRYITGWWCQRYMVTYASTYNCLYTLGCVTQPDQHHDVQAGCLLFKRPQQVRKLSWHRRFQLGVLSMWPGSSCWWSCWVWPQRNWAVFKTPAGRWL